MKKSLINKIIESKKRENRIIAVGTTTIRVLGTVFDQKKNSNKFEQFDDSISGWTNMYIYHGYNFKSIDRLITNFHLPRSSLILLCSAFLRKRKTFQGIGKR